MKVKMKWQKLVSMALCLVMLLSMLPTQALAVTYINDVEIFGIEEPVIGRNPSTEVSYTPSSGMNVSCRWVYFDSKGLGHNMSATDVFQSGTNYALYVTATTKSGYVFPYTTEIDDYDEEYDVYSGRLTLNGQVIEGYVDNDGLVMNFNWWFKPAKSNKYTVTFNANGHGTAPAPQTVTKGGRATEPANPSASGYTFGGWYTDAACTKAFDFNTPINSNITLYAKWTKSLTAITKIEITVPKPVAGKTGDEVGKVPTVTTVPADAFTMSAGDWWNVSDGSYFTGKFEAGKSYSFGINLAPKAGYKFECDGDNYLGEVVVNGGTFEYTESDGNILFLSTIVKCEASQCATPVLTSAANVASGITVKWGAVDGAAKYRVFRKVSGGSWAKLTDTTSTSYTDTTAVAGTTYYYTVRCLDSTGKYCSAYDTKGKACRRLVNQTITSLTNASGGMVVKWPKSTGAAGYYVYRKTGTGSYAKIATITSGSTVSYTDAGVKDSNATTYTYAVRAYYGSSSSSYTGKSYVRLTTPAISTLTNVTGCKMKAVWGKKSSVSGYQIQYSTTSDFSSGNKSVTVSGASIVTKTISSLTKGKTYYVRIRTYKTVSGTNYYSGWSGKKSVKISK